MRQEAGAESVLFASVLNPHAHQAGRRARLLWVVPLVLALHVLAIVVLAPARREASRLSIRAEDDALVLKLLAAPPALPSAVAAAAAPAQAITRRVAPRKELLRLRPAAPPTPAPKAEEPLPPPEDIPEAGGAPSPHGTAEAEGGALSTDAVMDSEEGAAASEGGGILGGVLSSIVPPPPPPLTPEEREAWIERYVETIIRARFMRVRYPHQAAAAGIKGEVLLRVTISPQGRLLKLEQIGHCPHPVLCEAALKSMRNAEPLPPPPPELGNPCTFELPFRYRLY
jgi:periplasmic protein TonB